MVDTGRVAGARHRGARLLGAVLASVVVGAGLVAPTAQAAPVGASVPAAEGGQVVAWGRIGNDMASVPSSLAGHTVTAVAGGARHASPPPATGA